MFPHKQKYSTIGKEALAVKWVVDAQRYYLLGNPFQLVTDDMPPQMAPQHDRNQCLGDKVVSLPPIL